jgi:hypothetical protein
MTSRGKKREMRQHFEDVLTVSRGLELALFMGAKLDIAAPRP